MIISFFVDTFILISLLFTRDHFFYKKPVSRFKKSQVKKLRIVLVWLLLFLILAALSLGLWIYLDHEAVAVIDSILPQGIELQDYAIKADEFINTIRAVDLRILALISFFAGILLGTPLILARYSSIKPEQFLNRFTKKLVTFRWLIIFLAFIIAGSGIWADLDAKAETDVEVFMPQDLQALEDIHKLRNIVGTTDQVSIVYENEHVLSESSLNWVEDMTGKIEKEFPEVVVETNSITEVIKQLNGGEVPTGSNVYKVLEDIPDEQKQQLVNESETKGVIAVGIKHLEAEPLENFINDLKLYLQKNQPQNMKTTVTGKSVLDVEMVSALTTGRYKMTLLGMGLVFLGLLVIYRHPVKAFIPLLPIVLIIGWSGAFMALMGINYTPLTATLGALIIGIGTEFTILIMERFYEERKKGRSRLNAISIANQKIGKAIFASVITTIGGFGALLISDFVILSNFGMITLINISLALFSTMVVMPPILVILDRFVKVRPDAETDTSLIGETM